jgi:hypothetical protein
MAARKPENSLVNCDYLVLVLSGLMIAIVLFSLQ